MVQAWRSFSWMLPLLAVLIIIVLIALAVTVRKTNRELWTTIFIDRAIGGLLFICLFGLLLVTLSPGHGVTERVFVLSPLQASALGTPAQIVLNAVLFMPVGFLTTLRWRRFAAHRVLATSFSVPLGVELLQYLLGIGRIASTADLFLGVAGIIVGGLIALAPRRLLRRFGTSDRCSAVAY